MVIDNKHSLGEVVFLLTDDEQLRRVVTAISVRSGSYITYWLSQGINETSHVETEITKEKTLVL